ncbi:SDR family oxidoreductase [Sphingosinicella sp.]|uniref:SDR family oxidoreductase n=1 Tax=Sphingosinicella sp. TaxID=1917971 RepID=UPI004037AA56
MPTVLIAGANRGIGLEFARRYAAAGWEVIGTARDPEAAGDLRAVARVERLDASDLDRVAALASAREGRPLDLLIANAGTYGPRRIETAEDGEGWLETLSIMAVAPVLLANALLPNLRAANGKAVAITSRMGSIDDNNSGGFIAYRSAKAALNAAWTSLAIDNAGLAFALLHPGWVQTRMGGAQAPLPTEESVAGMMRVIDGLKPVGRAPFLDYQGETVPW